MLSALLDGNLSESEQLRALFAWIDERCATITPPAVCTPGCAHCCRGAVQMSEAEACLIAEFSGRSFTSNAQAASSPFSSVCPLLDSESKMCAVHEVRPSACRTRFAFDDASLCAKSAFHQTYNLANFAEDHDAELSRAGLRKTVRALNGGRADIRFFFG